MPVDTGYVNTNNDGKTLGVTSTTETVRMKSPLIKEAEQQAKQTAIKQAGEAAYRQMQGLNRSARRRAGAHYNVKIYGINKPYLKPQK